METTALPLTPHGILFEAGHNATLGFHPIILFY